jgi:RNA ligase
MYIDKEKINEEILKGNIRKFTHNDFPDLHGFNYTESCQFSKSWNEYTILCRGIIFEKDRIISRPFSKFFNIEELTTDIYNEKIRYIQNKEDGSLIISYLYNDKVYFATRGSFHSDQAIIAENIWNERYANKIDNSFFSKWTMLFELVGPLNRNVTRGYKEDDIILLSIIDIESGREAEKSFIEKVSEKLGCKRPLEFHASSARYLYKSIKENNDPNFEGVVITLDNGSKVKIKSNLYIQLHKVVTGSISRVSKYELWEEIFKNGFSEKIKDLNIPDEFFEEINESNNTISALHKKFYDETTSVFRLMMDDYNSGMSRKDLALKWVDHRWLISPVVLNLNCDDIILKAFKKRYMDGFYEQPQ